jgi:hypothetical protein
MKLVTKILVNIPSSENDILANSSWGERNQMQNK